MPCSEYTHAHETNEEKSKKGPRVKIREMEKNELLERSGK